jgi:UrcA family protein
MHTITKFAIAAVIAATSTSTLFTATVHAQSAESMSMSIKTADLDLSSPLGQERLNRRIDVAARQVCEDGSSIREITMRRAVNECITKATSQALIQVKGRGGQPLALKTTD